MYRALVLLLICTLSVIANEEGTINMYTRPGSETYVQNENVDSASLETHHVDLSEMHKGSDYFSFTLKEPLVDRISREAAAHYREPGWTIQDSRNREVLVSIDIPLDMRRQKPGKYEITYTAYLEEDYKMQHPLGVQKRTCEVYDVNVCELGTHDCSEHAYCIHLANGGYKCECKPGYRGSGQSCRDIDECSENLADCDIHSTCINLPGSYRCECSPGFRKVGDRCEDINECEEGTHDCSPHAWCKNLPGTYQCKCKEGYEGNGRVCTPINKCSTGEINCHPYANCIILDNGEYMCECYPGLRGDGVVSCEDIDECAEDLFNCPPNSHCRNTWQSYQCICDPGFQEINGHCEDIDECKRGTHSCPPNSDCYNEIGSYHCVCQEGFTKTEDGLCEDLSGTPKLTLKGDNPMHIHLFDTYSEPGFVLEEEREELRFNVNIPPKLHGVARHCGEFSVSYRAIDLKTEKETRKTRIVVVDEVDQCKLEPGNPYRHNCNELAQCVYLTGECDYVCQCPPGFDGDGRGPQGCRDIVPPIFEYNGPEPYIREVCQVCGSVISMPNLKDPVITRAYDNTLLGRKDVSDRIQLQTEPSPLNDDCIIHHYTVADDAGNVASKRLTVCLKIEDMRTTIMEMKAMYTWQMWLIRNVAFLCTLAFILVVVWEFGYRIASCIKVLTNANPTHDDKDTAYSLWYRITNPLASRATVRQYVNSCLIEDEESDDETDSDDDDYYSDEN